MQAAAMTIYSSSPNVSADPDVRFIYSLTPTDTGAARMPSYEVNSHIVVIARDSKVARKLAAARAIDEGADFWTNTVLSSCHKVGIARKPNGQHPARERVLCAEDNAS